ncbi:MAG: D-sedoheptulose-7-phosphate isomerase [Actinomycetota bacterium]
MTSPQKHAAHEPSEKAELAYRRPYTSLIEHLDDLSIGLASLAQQAMEIDEWATFLVDLLEGPPQARGRLLIAGNGGSAAEAQHLSAELVGRFENERRPLSAMVLHADTSTVTAVMNDYGAEEVFARQVEAHGRPGDILLVLSTSGRSPNIIRATERAQGCGLHVWALTGPPPNPLASQADRVVTINATSVSSIQEGHLVAVHALCGSVDSILRQQVTQTTLISPDNSAESTPATALKVVG